MFFLLVGWGTFSTCAGCSYRLTAQGCLGTVGNTDLWLGNALCSCDMFGTELQAVLLWQLLPHLLVCFTLSSCAPSSNLHSAEAEPCLRLNTWGNWGNECVRSCLCSRFAVPYGPLSLPCCDWKCLGLGATHVLCSPQADCSIQEWFSPVLQTLVIWAIVELTPFPLLP